MTCNKYLVNNQKELLLQNQNLYFDSEGRFKKNFYEVNHIEVDVNFYRISEGTILDQYVYMLAIVAYLQKERYLSFSKNDVLYFCCRENDLCRGSQVLAQGFATTKFQLDRFFVRQYISLFKLNYDLFFSLYQYFRQNYHNDICCDYFLDDKISETCDDEVLDQCYEDVPGSSLIMEESNGDVTINHQVVLVYDKICLGDNCSFKEVILSDHSDTLVLGVDCEWFFSGQDQILSSIQFSDGSSQIYVYDALSMSYDDEEFVKNLLESSNVLKVFHDCRNDARVLRKWKNVKLSNVYDTQVAYFFFNGKCELPISLANLISLSFKFYSKVNKVKFKKNFEDRSYWAKRPFSNDDLRYLMEDVFFLPFIYYQYEIYFGHLLTKAFQFFGDYSGFASCNGTINYGIVTFDSQLKSKQRLKKKKFVVKSSRRLALVPKKPKPRPGKQPSLKIKCGEKGKISFDDNKKRIKKVDALSDDDLKEEEEEEEIDLSLVKLKGHRCDN